MELVEGRRGEAQMTSVLPDAGVELGGSRKRTWAQSLGGQESIKVLVFWLSFGPGSLKA